VFRSPIEGPQRRFQKNDSNGQKMPPLPDARTDPLPHNRFAALIPVYNHGHTVADVVQRTLALDIPVVVVDDGSTDSTFERIRDIKGARVLRHRFNRGKGAAIMTGFAEVAKTSDWAITLDADGQHDPEDAKTLIRAVPATQRPIVIGKRQGMLAPGVPWTSRFGREFSNFWVRMAGGPVVADSQSGFRAYPLPECIHLGVKARRFQFEVEILAKARWNGIPVIEAPVSVSYSPGTRRISHFHPFFDFLRNTGLFSRLITYRILTLRFRGH
jgi:glycosyltransferase involved in cell wall biosynthesis